MSSFGAKGCDLIYSDTDYKKGFGFTTKVIEEDTGIYKSIEDGKQDQFESIGSKVTGTFSEISNFLSGLPVPVPYLSLAAPELKTVGSLVGKIVDKAVKDDLLFDCDVDFSPSKMVLAEGKYVYVYGLEVKDVDYFVKNVELGPKEILYDKKGERDIIYPHFIFSVSAEYTNMTSITRAIDLHKHLFDGGNFFKDILKNINSEEGIKKVIGNIITSIKK